MTADRFDEIMAEKDGKPAFKCPNCGSRKYTPDSGLDLGMVKLSPNWLRCLECNNLFIRNEEEDETLEE